MWCSEARSQSPEVQKFLQHRRNEASVRIQIDAKIEIAPIGNREKQLCDALALN
jgi:hypothetical protein